MHIIAPHFSCVVHAPLEGSQEPSELEQAISAGYNEIFVITPGGIIKYHKLRGENRFVTIKVDSIPGLKLSTVSESHTSFLPAGKVPRRLLDQIEEFFRQILAVHKDALEAMIWVMYNPEVGYYLHVPDQSISKASVRYEWDSVPSGSSIIVDVHSHNTMSAFFSGTDNGDDRNGIRYSGVFGNLDKPVASTVWRFNYLDKKVQCTLDDIFESYEKPAVEVPSEWLERVKVVTYRTPSYHRAVGVGYPGPSYGRGAAQTNNSNDGSRLSKNNGGNFQSDFWGLGDSSYGGYGGYGGYGMDRFGAMIDEQEEELYGRNRNETIAEAAERLAAQVSLLQDEDDAMTSVFGYDPMNRAADDHTLPTLLGLNNSDAEVEDPVGNPGVGEDYEMVAANHGVEAADAYDSISLEMVELEGKDDLLCELAGDMAGLMQDSKKRLELLRNIYSSLDRNEQEILATNGF